MLTKILFSSILLATSIASAYVQADNAKIVKYRYHATDIALPDWSGKSWILIDKELPGCKKTDDKSMVMINNEDTYAHSIIMAAKSSDKTVEVGVDLSITDHGFCKLQYISLY